MRVLMLTPDYYPDIYAGVGVHVMSLVNELSKFADIEIDIIVLRCERLATEKPNIYKDLNGFMVYEFGGKDNEKVIGDALDYFTFTWTNNNIAALNYISKQISEKKYDLIHCHDMFPIWIMDYFRRKLEIPVISTIHARATDEKKIEDALRGFLCRISDKCFAVSDNLRNELVERYGVSGIKVIYNGVSPSCYDEILKEKERYISYCGRLHETKGVDVLIRAFSNVLSNEKFKNYKLKIVGEGEMSHTLKNLSSELGIEKSVDFVGKVDNANARKIIHNSTLHIIPSLYEPFATSALEAMEEKTAVVASKVGGLKEMVVDGFNGVLTKPGDVDSLCEKIIEMLDNPQKRAELECNAKEYVKKYEWSNIALQIYKEYKKMINV